MFESTQRLTEEAQWMSVIQAKAALQTMNAPLHAGAYRY
ncbi:MAG: hypothetical protein GYB27_24615 [Rhodobacteraceae bacterium]|nr:hypothetical protein [Paracoccaceae bacterium]